MDPLQKIRPIGFGFLCCGLGLLTASLVTGQLPWVGIALACIGVGIVFVARARRAG